MMSSLFGIEILKVSLQRFFKLPLKESLVDFLADYY